MNYNFATDSEKIEDLVELLDSNITNAQTAINNIYETINNMGTDNTWTGSTYEAFVTKCNSYKESLENAISLLTAYKNILSNVHTNSTTLYTDIVNICNLDSE